MIAVYRCCRDWPVSPYSPLGRCGYCGERPVPTDKTLEQYLVERPYLPASPRYREGEHSAVC